MSSPRFSRPTSAAFAGKQSCTVKTMVSDEVADDFNRFARERGYSSTSDCLREILLVAVYGQDFLANLHRDRIASLVRNAAETVPAGK